MVVEYYRNNRNENKYLEVHKDGHGHNTVRQFMQWNWRRNGKLISYTRNYNGDCLLHRWRKENLKNLLTDYTKCAIM